MDAVPICALLACEEAGTTVETYPAHARVADFGTREEVRPL